MFTGRSHCRCMITDGITTGWPVKKWNIHICMYTLLSHCFICVDPLGGSADDKN